MKKMIRRILVSMVAVTILMVSNIQIAEGSVVLNKKRTYKDAYEKVLLKKKNLNNKADSVGTHFAIRDLNNDGVPELLISPEGDSVWDHVYYTFKRGSIIKIKGPMYSVYGGIHPIPSRGTFALFRGGPPSDKYMPNSIEEFKIVNKRAKKINTYNWHEYFSGKDKYFLNRKRCKAKKYKKVHNALGAMIDFVPNTKANRNKYLH